MRDLVSGRRCRGWGEASDQGAEMSEGAWDYLPGQASGSGFRVRGLGAGDAVDQGADGVVVVAAGEGEADEF